MPAPFRKSGELQRALERMLAAGRAAWPKVHLAPERFEAFLEERVPEGAAAAQVDALHAADLYLACACAQRDRAALEALERGPLQVCAAAAARVDRSPTFADEV